MAKDYYTELRPEFSFALNFAVKRQLKNVLDVGGGEGGFLDLARKRGLETVGVELNRAAAERAAAKGHHIISKLLEQVGVDEVGGGVDLLTMFQVVEHVPDPVQFTRDAARLVSSGGFIVISVPNEYRGLGLLPYDPANWPPHHVSRWRKKDLHQLAHRVGWRVVATSGDILYGRMLEAFIVFHNQLSAAIGRRPYPVDARTAAALSFVYRKLGCKFLFPRLGLSLYAILQK